jgi:hypothetical protein
METHHDTHYTRGKIVTGKVAEEFILDNGHQPLWVWLKVTGQTDHCGGNGGTVTDWTIEGRSVAITIVTEEPVTVEYLILTSH